MSNIDRLELHRGNPTTYGVPWATYALPPKNVPFAHSVAAPLGRPCSPLRRLGFLHLPLLASLLLLLFVPAAGAGTLTLEQLVARAQEAYEKTADLQARFVQEVAFKAMQRTEREEGTVYFKNPRMMLWDYSRPKGKRLVISAHKAWFYVPEDRTVYVQKADDVYRSRMAVKFLSGIGNLAEDFQIQFAGEPAEKGTYLLALKAKEAGTGIDRLQLALDRQTFQVTRCRFDDTFGNRTTLRFSDIRVNTGLEEGFFSFRIPPGTEVINLP